MYQRQLRDELSQGDIIAEIPINYTGLNEDGTLALDNEGKPRFIIEYRPAIVLSRDCEIDKSSWILVAEVRPLSEVNQHSQGNVRNYKTRNTFYLPKLPGVFEESYVEFRVI